MSDLARGAETAWGSPLVAEGEKRMRKPNSMIGEVYAGSPDTVRKPTQLQDGAEDPKSTPSGAKSKADSKKDRKEKKRERRARRKTNNDGDAAENSSSDSSDSDEETNSDSDSSDESSDSDKEEEATPESTERFSLPGGDDVPSSATATNVAELKEGPPPATLDSIEADEESARKILIALSANHADLIHIEFKLASKSSVYVRFLEAQLPAGVSHSRPRTKTPLEAAGDDVPAPDSENPTGSAKQSNGGAESIVLQLLKFVSEGNFKEAKKVLKSTMKDIKKLAKLQKKLKSSTGAKKKESKKGRKKGGNKGAPKGTKTKTKKSTGEVTCDGSATGDIVDGVTVPSGSSVKEKEKEKAAPKLTKKQLREEAINAANSVLQSLFLYQCPPELEGVVKDATDWADFMVECKKPKTKEKKVKAPTVPTAPAAEQKAGDEGQPTTPAGTESAAAATGSKTVATKTSNKAENKKLKNTQDITKFFQLKKPVSNSAVQEIKDGVKQGIKQTVSRSLNNDFLDSSPDEKPESTTEGVSTTCETSVVGAEQSRHGTVVEVDVLWGTMRLGRVTNLEQLEEAQRALEKSTSIKRPSARECLFHPYQHNVGPTNRLVTADRMDDNWLQPLPNPKCTFSLLDELGFGTSQDRVNFDATVQPDVVGNEEIPSRANPKCFEVNPFQVQRQFYNKRKENLEFMDVAVNVTICTQQQHASAVRPRNGSSQEVPILLDERSNTILRHMSATNGGNGNNNMTPIDLVDENTGPNLAHLATEQNLMNESNEFAMLERLGMQLQDPQQEHPRKAKQELLDPANCNHADKERVVPDSQRFLPIAEEAFRSPKNYCDLGISGHNAEVILVAWFSQQWERMYSKPAYFGSWNSRVPVFLRHTKLVRFPVDQEIQRLTSTEMHLSEVMLAYSDDSGDDWDEEGDGDDGSSCGHSGSSISDIGSADEFSNTSFIDDADEAGQHMDDDEQAYTRDLKEAAKIKDSVLVGKLIQQPLTRHGLLLRQLTLEERTGKERKILPDSEVSMLALTNRLQPDAFAQLFAVPTAPQKAHEGAGKKKKKIATTGETTAPAEGSAEDSLKVESNQEMPTGVPPIPAAATTVPVKKKRVVKKKVPSAAIPLETMGDPSPATDLAPASDPVPAPVPDSTELVSCASPVLSVPAGVVGDDMMPEAAETVTAVGSVDHKSTVEAPTAVLTSANPTASPIAEGPTAEGPTVPAPAKEKKRQEKTEKCPYCTRMFTKGGFKLHKCSKAPVMPSATEQPVAESNQAPVVQVKSKSPAGPLMSDEFTPGQKRDRQSMECDPIEEVKEFSEDGSHSVLAKPVAAPLAAEQPSHGGTFAPLGSAEGVSNNATPNKRNRDAEEEQK